MDPEMICLRAAEVGDATVEYGLTVKNVADERVYSIILKQKNGDVHRVCLLRDIARVEDRAKALLSILADNGVTVDTVPYIMDDLAAEMTFC